MTPDTPKVSIVIATYNWSAALRCALRSVRHQTCTDFEVLVVGDGCSDDSEAVVRSFGDPRFSWHNLARNHGSQWAPNNFGLEHARGEWIAYLGHDDIWHPDHLATTVAAAESSGAGAAVATLITYGPPRTGVIQMAGVFGDETMSPRDFVPPSALVHRRDLVAAVGPWSDPAALALQTDCEFLLRIAGATRVVATNELTAFKFNASSRRDAYIRKSVVEQEAMLAKIERGGEFRHHELMLALKAGARDTFSWAVIPDVGEVAVGAIAQACRRFKGTEARFEAEQMRRPDQPIRFGLEHQYGGYEWHDLEQHPTHGTFRWSGPAPKAAVDLPVVPDRALVIRARILGAIDVGLLHTLRMTVNGQPADVDLQQVGDAFDVRVRVGAMNVDHLSVGFEVDRTMRPLDLGVGPDRRCLGLAVNWIEVSPDDARASAA